MTSIPLSAEDRAILNLEGPSVAGHTCKVLVLAAPVLSLEELRGHVEAGLPSAPALIRRLGGSEDQPTWVDDPKFDLTNHVVAGGRGPIAREALPEVTAAAFAERLDRSLPLWQIGLVPIKGGGSALIWRLHHALADGTAAIRFARTLLFDPPVDAGSVAPAGAGHSRPETGAEADHSRRRGHLGAMIRRELAESLEGSPFDGPIGTDRAIAFATVEFKPLHDAAHELAGATINDAILTVIGGAVRRWIEHQHGHIRSLRVRVPVSLHQEGDDVANRDSFFTLPVPIDAADPVARLRQVAAATAERKRADDAERLDSLLGSLHGHAGRLAALVERLESGSRSFALCVSNVRGPADPVQVLGRPVEELYTIAEIGRRHGLRVAVISYAGRLWLGFCADPAIVEGIERMASAVTEEADALIAAAGAA